MLYESGLRFKKETFTQGEGRKCHLCDGRHRALRPATRTDGVSIWTPKRSLRGVLLSPVSWRVLPVRVDTSTLWLAGGRNWTRYPLSPGPQYSFVCDAVSVGHGLYPCLLSSQESFRGRVHSVLLSRRHTPGGYGAGITSTGPSRKEVGRRHWGLESVDTPCVRTCRGFTSPCLPENVTPETSVARVSRVPRESLETSGLPGSGERPHAVSQAGTETEVVGGRGEFRSRGGQEPRPGHGQTRRRSGPDTEWCIRKLPDPDDPDEVEDLRRPRRLSDPYTRLPCSSTSRTGCT